MNLDNIKKNLCNISYREDVCLKDMTTFRVGGKAGLFVEPKNFDELSTVLKLVKEEKLPYFVLGNGSNLLVSDEGYDGVVIHLAGDFLNLSCEGDSIYAGAGAILARVCSLARDNSLTGLEFAYGIPGTIGGALVMNAGAYDGEMRMVVEEVELMTPEGDRVTLGNEEMKFSYRHSLLKEKEMLVLGAKLSLSKGDKLEIEAKMQDFMNRRRSKQPLEFPSAGSTFKRPEGFFAGKLIEDAGLKGFRVGGACVSEKHCGFVVNDKNGTASDINVLMNRVASVVYEKSGVTLEPEVIKVGKF